MGVCGLVGMWLFSRLWLFSRFHSHLFGCLYGCLWFGGYVNFVEYFGFMIVGFGGFARFGGL